MEQNSETFWIFDADGEPVSVKSKSRVTPLIFTLVCVALCVAALCAGYLFRPQSKKHTADGGFILSASSSTVYSLATMDSPATPVSNRKTQADLDYALSQWSKVLGGKKIARPGLFIGAPVLCVRDALACADRSANTIILQRGSYSEPYDMRSILLHEVGHLLGVPHIEDDALMNPSSYGNKVQKPSPFAVAIAKEVMSTEARSK